MMVALVTAQPEHYKRKPPVNQKKRLGLCGCLLLAYCSATNAHVDLTDQTAKAPASLAGQDLVLQIERTTSSFTGGYPYKGAVVKHYSRGGTFTAQGTGTGIPDSQQVFTGSFKYQRTGPATAIEQSIDTSVNNSPLKVRYTFTTRTSGTWEEDFDGGKLKLSGRFTMHPSDLPQQQHLAPTSLADTTVALIIKSAKSDLPTDVYPTGGLVVQSYAIDGSVLLKGFGPRTLDSTGTYKYTKVAPNTAVEEVTQVSPLFTLPYTMVYSFETPSSGTWFQNLGDGLILFWGTFDLFPSK